MGGLELMKGLKLQCELLKLTAIKMSEKGLKV